jgi:hypothetical protein
MLIILSTCDYIVDNLLDLVVYGLQNLTQYLCESIHSSLLPANKEHENEIKAKNEYLIDNCVDLLECLDRILQIRHLQYYPKLSSNTISNLNKFLEFVFINLTDVYPLLAVRLTKLLQFLNK